MGMEYPTTEQNCLIENKNLNDQESFFCFLPKSNFGMLLEDNGCKTVNFTFVDHRHPNFSTEYEKVNLFLLFLNYFVCL